MLEKLDQIIDSVHRAYNLTAFDIDKCLKAAQVKNLNEARTALRDAQSELELLRWGEQHIAARWPATMGHLHRPMPVPPGESGLLIEGTMQGKVEWRSEAPTRPQTIAKCNAMTYDQCRTCYEVNDRDCCGYEDRMQEAREMLEAQREAK